MQFAGQQTVEYESNPQLFSTDIHSAVGSLTAPQVIIAQDSPLNHFDLTALADIYRFSLPSLSSDDFHGSVHETAKGDIWQNMLTASYDYDTTRTSEVTSSGVAIAGTRHNGWSVQPQSTVFLSPTDTVELAGSYYRSEYSNPNLFTGYDYWGVTPTYLHALDPLNVVTVSGQFTQFSTLNGSPVTIRNEGAQFGINHTFSQTFTATFSVGFERSDWQFAASQILPNTASNSYNFNATLNYAGQQDTINLTAGRNPTPNGFGTETISTTLNLFASHALTPLYAAKINLFYLQSDFPPGTTAFQRVAASSFIEAAPGALYHLTDSVSVDLTYQYRRNQSVGGTDRTDNDIKFNIIVQLHPEPT